MLMHVNRLIQDPLQPQNNHILKLISGRHKDEKSKARPYTTQINLQKVVTKGQNFTYIEVKLRKK